MLKKLSTRERTLLVVLALATLGVFWMVSGGDGEDGARDAAAESGDAAADQPPVVRMDLLAGLAGDYNTAGRDLFKYSKRPPTAEELAARKAREEAANRARLEADKRRQEAAERRRSQPQKQVEQGPRPPRITFKYLGKVGPKEDLHAVFADGDEIMIARVGEVIKKDFKVVNIDYQTVVMGYTRPEFEDRTESLTMTNK